MIEVDGEKNSEIDLDRNSWRAMNESDENRDGRGDTTKCDRLRSHQYSAQLTCLSTISESTKLEEA